MSVRFAMIGGFLGAGKTTTVARLARTYMASGQKVAVVTNDQANDLVDTHSLRSQGLTVGEVPGACFCCKFEELVERVGSLEKSNRPDVILAEPVGSCTDLIATVVQPLKDLYQGRFSVAPYPVLFKPSHGKKILKNASGAGFSPKAAYIFTKQLEEADAIVLNRVDELSLAEVDEIVALVQERFPRTPVLQVSATTGRGFDALVELLDQDGRYGAKILDIDYDIYAEGEAELGWLNANIQLQSATPFNLDLVLLAIVQGLHAKLNEHESEVAHLKVIGTDDGGAFGVANMISNDTPVMLSLSSGVHTIAAHIIVNARVAMDPSELEKDVRMIAADVAKHYRLEATFGVSQSLRPGRPTPTHRYVKAIG